MDDLDHSRGTILEEIVPNLSLDGEASGTRPLCVLLLELTEELRRWPSRGDCVEVGRVGIDRRRCSAQGGQHIYISVEGDRSREE